MSRPTSSSPDRSILQYSKSEIKYTFLRGIVYCYYYYYTSPAFRLLLCWPTTLTICSTSVSSEYELRRLREKQQSARRKMASTTRTMAFRRPQSWVSIISCFAKVFQPRWCLILGWGRNYSSRNVLRSRNIFYFDNNLRPSCLVLSDKCVCEHQHQTSSTKHVFKQGSTRNNCCWHLFISPLEATYAFIAHSTLCHMSNAFIWKIIFQTD